MVRPLYLSKKRYSHSKFGTENNREVATGYSEKKGWAKDEACKEYLYSGGFLVDETS